MGLQKACHIIEKLLEEEAKVEHGRLTFAEFLAINNMLLELQLSGKHTPKDSYTEKSDAK